VAGPLLAGWIEGGRTRHALIRSGDDFWVLKEYRRGGLIGRWNVRRYWRCERFFEELRVSVLAAAAGVPTAEALALILESAGAGSVRAWLLTRYLEGVRPLHEYVTQPAAGAVFEAAGDAVRRMHDAGIDHRDLNVGNIVGSLAGEPRAHIVDWDRARRRPHGSWNPLANLVRLWRSAEKARRLGALRRSDSPSSPEVERALRGSLRAFARGYFRGRPGSFAAARSYFRRHAPLLGMHALLWRRRR
jgi:3-deoxy-D-manno-octulosonic acid kinase